MTDDLVKVLAQAQKLTRELEARKVELARREVIGEAGAGLVTAVMNGIGELLRVKIDPQTFRGDQNLVEDLIVGAVSAALTNVRELQHRELRGLTATPAVLNVTAKDGAKGE